MGSEANKPHETFSMAPAPVTSLKYATAMALDTAIAAKISLLIERGSAFSHNELRRQFAYDRLLARVFTAASDQWILKGGGALLARLPSARHTTDLDLAYNGGEDIASALIQTTQTNLGDFFQFRFGDPTGPAPDEDVVLTRLPVHAWIGRKRFENFHLDLVASDPMTTAAETAAPLSPIDVEGLLQHPYRLYPLVDHIADKHAAMLGTYRTGTSTRYRDLVDLAIIASTQRVDAQPMATALFTKYAKRGLTAPQTVAAPGPDWAAGYARTIPDGFAYPTLESALALVRTFLDPVLHSRAAGQWDPAARRWRD